MKTIIKLIVIFVFVNFLFSVGFSQDGLPDIPEDAKQDTTLNKPNNNGCGGGSDPTPPPPKPIPESK